MKKAMNPITANCHWQKNWMYPTDRTQRGWWVHKISKIFRSEEQLSSRHRFRKRLMMLCSNKHRIAKMRLESLRRHGDGCVAYKSPELISPKNPEWY